MNNWYKIAQEIESENIKTEFLKQFKPKSLVGLAAEALKSDNPKEFEKDYIIQIKHGTYWHITDNPNFYIDPLKGPRDMSSMADGSMTIGKLMVTSHLEYWAENYKGLRGYAAEIDLSMVKDPSKAKVIRLLPINEALKLDKYRHSKMPQSYEELEAFYYKTWKDFNDFKVPKEINNG